MINRTSQNAIVLLLGFLWVIPVTAWAGGYAGSTPFADQVILVPDDPNSIATIDGPWDAPLAIRVVTVSDVPILSGAAGDNSDPSQPNRFATAVRHPSGEIVEINLLEVAQRILEIRTRRGMREYVEWVVNTELPFTREAQLRAAIEGFDIHRQARTIKRGFTQGTDNSTCWLTGKNVLQIPVLFDPDRSSSAVYGVKIVPVGGLGGLMGRAEGENSGANENNGGDPAGNPDQPPLTGDDDGGNEPPDSGGDPIDGPLEGGDPGGNPDPPPRGID